MDSIVSIVAIVGLLVGVAAIARPLPRIGLDTRGRALGLAVASMITMGLASGQSPASDPVALPPAPTTSTVASSAAEPIAAPTSTSTAVSPYFDVAFDVVNVVDGDTIKVLLADGTSESVRLIGIDTPEPNEESGPDATRALTDLIGDDQVVLRRDVSERDRFGRILAYVYVGDTFLNERMVALGWAVARRYSPDIAMASVLEGAESSARSASLGAWSVVDTTTTMATTTTAPPTTTTTVTVTTTTSTTTTAPTTTTTSAGNCDPSYPDVCIPPAPPDLDCGEISFRRFRVTGSDPHGFDGDGDGIGCES